MIFPLILNFHYLWICWLHSFEGFVANMDVWDNFVDATVDLRVDGQDLLHSREATGHVR